MSIAVLFSNNKGELRQINICRIYLQAISTADVCNFDDTRMAQQAYDGSFILKNTNICWPNQHRPSKGGWLVWHRFLGSFFDGNRYIFQPLVSWKDVKLLPLPQPPLRARTDARTNPSAQRATQLRSVLARVYIVSRQNQITTNVP
jgi:hypothetical protein